MARVGESLGRLPLRCLSLRILDAVDGFEHPQAESEIANATITATSRELNRDHHVGAKSINKDMVLHINYCDI